MHVELVPTYLTHVVWPQVEGFVSFALEYSQGEYTPDQARQLIALGHWALFIASDKDGVVKGAACVQFNNMPNDRVAFVVAIGGKLFTNPETWEQFVKILSLMALPMWRALLEKALLGYGPATGLKKNTESSV